MLTMLHLQGITQILNSKLDKVNLDKVKLKPLPVKKKSAIRVGNGNIDKKADDDSSWYSEDLSQDLSDNDYNEGIVSFSEFNNNKPRNVNVEGRQPGDVKDIEESRLNRSESDSYSEDSSQVSSDAGNQELI